MDILGYSEMIRRAIDTNSQQDFLGKIHEALTEGRAWLENTYFSEEDKSLVKDDGFALKAFTDNIVIGWPVYEDAELEFGLAFSTLAYFQLQMVKKGFFVRGALSVGSAYIDDVAVSGEALVEAHIGETELARDPRIILTSSAVETVQKHLTYYADKKGAPQSRDVLCDSDGQWFVNYLECVVPDDNEHAPAYTDLFLHKAAVEEELRRNKSRPAIWSKYAWVAGYHNYFCDLYPRLFREKHKIKLELFRSSPSRIA
jgi:hypothetical protein